MPKISKYQSLKPIGNTQNPDSLYYFLLRFIKSCETSGIADSTIYARTSSLRKFIIWCDDRGLVTPQDITRPILERYQRHLFLSRQQNGKPISIACQVNYLSHIRSFFSWLAKSNYILYNPASDLDTPKINRRLPKNILSISEAEAIINQPDTNTILGLRDRAILEVFYSTGIRRSELANLKTTDIDYDRGTVLIQQGKGNKDRMIPIGERALSWIEKYMTQARIELEIGLSDNYLFLGNHGKAATLGTISLLVSKYIKQADIGKTGSCHLFRHTMATLMLENGADIRYIQAMLGHANLETTQIYTQVSISKLKSVHTATHPAKHSTKSQQRTKDQE